MKEVYTHRVKYYETDKMGVTHHSNYVRWMEEARVDFMDKIGYRKIIFRIYYESRRKYNCGRRDKPLFYK